MWSFLSILIPNPLQKHHLLGLCPMWQVCLVFLTPKCCSLVFSPTSTAFSVDPTYWVLYHWLLLIVFHNSISLCIIYQFICHDLHSWPAYWWNCQKPVASVGNSENHHKEWFDRIIFQKKKNPPKLQPDLFVLCSRIIQYDTGFSLCHKYSGTYRLLEQFHHFQCTGHHVYTSVQ